MKESVLYIEGGNIQRFFIKMLGLLFLYIGLISSFSFRGFLYNFPIKIPLLYYAATVIYLIPIFLSESYPYTSEHILAINFVFFIPLLFINFYGEKGDDLFTILIKILIWVVCFQLLLDLVIKLLNLHYVPTILGGMGNANTFGLHLIIAALGLRFVYRKHILSNVLLIFTWGTGSLMCVLISSLLLLQSLVYSFLIRPLGFFLLLGFILIAILAFLTVGENFSIYVETLGPVKHALKKISELSVGEADNVLARISFMIDAWELMLNSPISIIFGHPNFIPFWTTDGFFLTLLVTLGLPAMLFFMISNIYLFFRGQNEKTQLCQFASYTILVYLSFFCSNRILDYWPSGLMYLLVFNYLSRKTLYIKRKRTQ